MKLEELKNKIDFYCLHGGIDGIEVCIPNNKGGMGGTPVTKVKFASRGFDWDSDKFMITPDVPMVEMTKEWKEDQKIENDRRHKLYLQTRENADRSWKLKLKRALASDNPLEAVKNLL